SNDLLKNSNLSEVEITRALQFLSNKGIVKLSEEEKGAVDLGKNGRLYREKKLPERRLLEHLTKLRAIRFEDAEKRVGLTREELTVAIGILKKRLLVAIDNNRIILKVSVEEAKRPTLEERFLEQLPQELETLTPENKFAFQELSKRKEIIEVKKSKDTTIKLTEFGKKFLGEVGKIKQSDFIEQLTPEIIMSEKWKEKKFRRYDLTAKLPKIYGGKRQPYYSFLQGVRKKLITLGFKEMLGSLVENEFWNYDALFQPQFHIARDWAATYYVKASVDLPSSAIVKKVKEQHEKSWQYKWQIDKAKRSILRPQGTVLSARMLASKPQIPGKYFALARCYRPDVVDAKHLTEFNQVEGIILEGNANFQELMGMLKQFAQEIAGAKEVRFLPDYYPFTEPSVQMNVKFGNEWMEIGGAGIFREELTRPLGINVPVLAWGLGIDRLAMLKLGIKDIRQLFSHDLEWLRESKLIL
ncbi:MAG: phenylalanine--tRNA ligase subunit alpha, partial [Nanoarchaeota archaeon]